MPENAKKRNKNVPVNSPHIATKWARKPRGRKRRMGSRLTIVESVPRLCPFPNPGKMRALAKISSMVMVSSFQRAYAYSGY